MLFNFEKKSSTVDENTSSIGCLVVLLEQQHMVCVVHLALTHELSSYLVEPPRQRFNSPRR